MAHFKVSIFAIALVAILPVFIQGAAVPNAKQLKYIGSLTTPRFVRGASISAATSYYFLSQNAAGYATAAEDCKAFLGDDATLLYIETQEELADVTQLLQSSDDTGSSYWVGGRYDTAKQTFIWESGVEIGPWAPWDAGHPNTQVPVTRVFAYTVGGIKLRTQFNTVSTRYICELKAGLTEEDAEPCYNDNDLVIAVDSSGSVGQVNYEVALEFTTRLATAWADNPKNRLAIVVYSTTTDIIFGLNQNLTVSEIKDKIYNSNYRGGNTASHLALDATVQQVTQNPRQVPLNLVFLTDGGSNDPALTKASAEAVKAAGIRAFSVGIGSGINAAELLTIAGNVQAHVFNTNGFDDLLKLLQPVSRKVCE